MRSHPSEETLVGQGSGGPRGGSLRSRSRGTLSPEEVGEALGRWQRGELRLARGFADCRGLSTEQLEDLYQETALALLTRRYHDERHLRNALRTGLKHRALNLHRDERRHGEILAYSAPGMYRAAQASQAQDGPERAALLDEDRLIVSEFLTELSATEQRVFWLLAEGMGYRAIAPVLHLQSNEARNASRSCERKRERFQLLYDTGRLCGFRAQTIRALQSGEATSEELAERAFAHLESCAHCRSEHKTNAKRLRRSFQGQAAALLPLPLLLDHLGWLARAGVRARTVQYRLLPDGVPIGQGGLRERAIALLAGAGAAGKVAATVVTVTVIAGGTLGATHVLEHRPPHHHHRASHSAAARPRASSSQAELAGASLEPSLGANSQGAVHTPTPERRASPGHVVPITHRASAPSRTNQREPGGFAYLGVPTGTSIPQNAPEPAHTAARGSGGLFSP